MTDLYSGWTECPATWNKRAEGGLTQIKAIQKALHPTGLLHPLHHQLDSKSDLSAIQPVTPKTAGFSESVARANQELAKGYKRLQNEF